MIPPSDPRFADSSLAMAARFAGLRSPAAACAEAPAVAAADASRYEFGETFARGGLGRIRRAYDRRLHRVVAIKELHDHRRGGTAESRFMREALITARLEHPAIVPIHDVGTHPDGEPYYCMKLVDGRSLESIVQATSDLGERLALLPHVLAVADALAYAHDRQVVHRDLKPSNVLVGPFGETVVIDWGLAKDLREVDDEVPETEDARTPPDYSALRSLTQTGELLGTLPYMPIEQATGGTVGPSADVYAIGALLYFVLGGRPPYDGAETSQLYQRVLAGPPPDLLAHAPDTPADLAAVVRRAMARRADDRYASARELAADLRRFQAGRMVSARTYSPLDILRYLLSCHRTLLSTIGISFVLLAALGGFSYVRITHENAEAERQRAQAVESGALAEQRSAEARREAGRARDAAFAALLASGRHLLFDLRRPDQALPVLNEAYHLAPDDRRVKMMLGEATKYIDALQRTYTLPAAASQVRFDPDTHRLLAVDGKGGLHVWHVYGGWSEPEPVEAEVVVRAAEFVPGPADDLLVRSAADELLYYADGQRRWRLAMPANSQWSFMQVEGTNDVFVAGQHGLLQVDRATGGVIWRWQLPPSLRTVELLSHSSLGAGVYLLGRGQRADGHGVFEAVTVLRLDVVRGRVSVVMRGHCHNKHRPVVSHDGRWLSYVGEEPEAPDGTGHYLLDLHGRGRPRPLDRCEPYAGNRPWGPDAEFGSDDRRIFRMVNEHQLVSWDVATGKCEDKATLSGDQFDSIRRSHDGHTLVAIGRNGTVALLAADSLGLQRQYSPGTASITDVAISPGSQRVAIADADGHVSVWSLGGGRTARRDPVTVTSSPWISTTAGSDGRMTLHWRSPQAVKGPFHTTVLAQDIPEGPVHVTEDYVAVLDERRTATIWARDTRERSCSGISLGAELAERVMTASAPGRLVFVDFVDAMASSRTSRAITVDVDACQSTAVDLEGVEVIRVSHRLDRTFYQRVDGAARIVDHVTGTIVATIGGEREPSVFSTLAPDGRALVTSTGRGRIRLYDMRTGELRAELRPPGDVAITWMYDREAAFFAPDGRTFVTASPGGPLDVWDLETLTPFGELHGHAGTVERVVFDDDSTRAVSFSSDGLGDSAIYLWDMDELTGTRLAVEGVTEAVFAPDGEVLATGTYDGVVTLWDAATGMMVGRVDGPSRVRSLVFVSDGGRLAIADADGVIRPWNLPLETRTSEELDALLAAPLFWRDDSLPRRPAGPRI